MKSPIIKKIITSLFLILCSVGLFFMWKKPAQTSSQNELLVGINAQFPPFAFIKEGTIIGFDIDLVDAVAKKLNRKAVFKDLAFDMLLLEAQTGQVHVIASGITPTAERSKKILFTQPYIGNDDPLVAVTNKQDVITQFEDMYGKDVIVNDGFTAEAQMKKYPEISVKPLPTVADAFLALNHKRAFAFVTAQNTLVPFFEKYGKENYNIFILNFFEPAALGISKLHTTLLEPIQKALDELKNDGTLQKIKNKWNLK